MKLHELLAVGGQLGDQADKTRGELRTTFQKREHHFSEKIETYHPLAEGEQAQTESQLSLQSTIHSELDWIGGIWKEAIDVALQIADANCTAASDIILDDGTLVLAKVPATALMELMKRAGEIQELITSVPTLDPAKGFEPDPARGEGVYKARERTAHRTKKKNVPLVLFPATAEHPAQTQLVTEDVIVGRITTQEWSGLVTPAEKADMLARAEGLRRAIKRALSRANEVDIANPRKIGERLFKYVFTNKLPPQVG